LEIWEKSEKGIDKGAFDRSMVHSLAASQQKKEKY